MTKRFIFRNESFGGMILDRDTGLELMLNPTAFLISRLYIEQNIQKNDIIKRIKENYYIESETDLDTQIDAILEDVHNYFTSKNGKIIKWNSEYCFNDPISLSSPISVFWEITCGCNLSCLHCYNFSGKKTTDELSTTDCYILLKELANMGVLNLIIGGGEPFFRKDFINILKMADDLGFKILVATNGTLLVPQICSKLSKLSRLILYLSIHDYIPERHDRFCGVNGAFNKVLQSIKNLNNEGIEFGVQTMITNDNKHYIPEFFKFISSVNAKSWSLKARVNIGREKINQACLTDGDFHTMEGLITDLKKESSNPIPIHVESPMRITIDKDYQLSEAKNRQIGCGPGVRNCGILPNGYLVPCSFLRGDIWLSECSVKDAGFNKLWKESKIFKPFRELNSNQLGICNTCSLLGNGCNGGCRARAYNEYDDFFCRDPQCHLKLKHSL